MKNNRKRTFLLIIVFCCCFFLVFLRLLDLQIIHHGFYVKKSLDQRRRIINLAVQRGDILDRHGSLLATTIDTFSVFTYEKGGFSWLARKLPENTARAMLAKNPRQRGILKEKKRVYPKGHLAAQLIGFVGTDNEGLSGVELSFDEYLRGKEGRIITEGDPAGRELYGAMRKQDPGADGMNLTLTIDENIQYVAEREINAQVAKYHAISGTCIIMNAKTGEILALASKPDFDPNNYRFANFHLWHPRVLDPYEPGSTFKVITAAAGLQEGVITKDSMLKALDQIVVGGKVIENSHSIHWPGSEITISKMLEQSINTGAAQIGMKMGPERFYNQIRNFGFGERTNFGLQGESKGIVRHWRDWYKPDVAMITFGQSIAVNPIQLIAAIGSLANDGKRIKPFVVKKIESGDGNFVKMFTGDDLKTSVSKQVAQDIKELMNNVVIKGSGRKAKMENFKVCGKTGTAQKTAPGGRGYLQGHYVASFIGFAPMDDPQLVGLIIVDDPKGCIWGETVCGPAFQKVVEYSLRYLSVKPDVL